MLKLNKQLTMRRLERNDRGQSLTELAILMVFLLVMVAGVVDIGRAFFTYIELRDAVQEGALFASLGLVNDINTSTPYRVVACQPDSSFPNYPDVETVIKSSSDNMTNYIDAGLVTVTCNIPNPYCAGDNLEITVTYNSFPLTMPFIGTLIGRQTVEISASIIETIVTSFPFTGCSP